MKNCEFCDRSRREHDLVRQMRGELFQEGLITQEEYAALASEHGGVQRLEGYDSLRAQLAEEKSGHDEAIRQMLDGADALRAQMEEARKEIDDLGPSRFDAEVRAQTAEAALTAAQGEVAVLRAAAEAYFNAPITKLRAIHDAMEAALTSTRASADAYDERVRREALEAAIAVTDAEARRADETRTAASKYYGVDTATRIALAIRALAHPTKEPR